MDYNRFYRRRDKRKRVYSAEDKAQLRKLALFCAAMMLLGAIAGLIYIRLAG